MEILDRTGDYTRIVYRPAALHCDRTRFSDQMGDFGLEHTHAAGPAHKTWQNYTTVQILVPIAARFGSIAIKLF